MNRRHTIYLVVCILILSIGWTANSGSKSDNVDICDPKIIAQIQEGTSSKEDVKQLIGDPDKVETLFSEQELWKYKYSVSTHSGSGSQSGFGASGQLRTNDSSSFSSKNKNCNVHVVFGKNGFVKKVRESKVSGIGVLGH